MHTHFPNDFETQCIFETLISNSIIHYPLQPATKKKQNLDLYKLYLPSRLSDIEPERDIYRSDGRSSILMWYEWRQKFKCANRYEWNRDSIVIWLIQVHWETFQSIDSFAIFIQVNMVWKISPPFRFFLYSCVLFAVMFMSSSFFLSHSLCPCEWIGV